MSDAKSLPAWKRAQSLAHTIYALVDEAGLHQTDAGQRLRRASVSVPSLVAEACLVLTGTDQQEALVEAGRKLEEVHRLLPELASSCEADLRPLEEEIAGLGEELRGLAAVSAG